MSTPMPEKAMLAGQNLPGEAGILRKSSIISPMVVSKHRKKILIICTAVLTLISILVIAKILYPEAIFFNAKQPASLVSDIPERFKLGEVKTDIVYCGQQKLDLYEPRAKLFTKQPLVIYIHGGSWKANNKTSDAKERMLIDGLRDKGFALASIDYRLAPKYKYPEPQQDVLCAVRFLRANSIRFSLDPDKFAVVGFSAGGNLAALIGVLDSKSSLNNGQFADVSSRVKAVVGIAGVYDFRRNLRPNSIANIRNLMQGVKPDSGAPISYVTSDDSAFLLVHGNKDDTVPASQDAIFGEKLKSVGVPFEQLKINNANHILTSDGGTLSPPISEVSNTIQQFIIRKLQF